MGVGYGLSTWALRWCLDFFWIGVGALDWIVLWIAFGTKAMELDGASGCLLDRWWVGSCLALELGSVSLMHSLTLLVIVVPLFAYERSEYWDYDYWHKVPTVDRPNAKKKI